MLSGLCFAAQASFLKPAAFPTVADDLSFIDRIRLRAAGYDELNTVYDENGKCISGCAYAELNLEDELSAMARRDALVHSELVSEYGFNEQPDGSITPPEQNEWTAPVTFPGQEPQDCAVYKPGFIGKVVPYGSPLGYVSCISSDYGATRNIDGKTNVHHGIDLRATTGTPIYAPADGVVITIFNMNETCGNGVIIQHAGGYRTQYCHLSEVSIGKTTVSAGCLIGKVGNTGRSTGPHLHYAVKKWDGKSYRPVNPRPFIEPEHDLCR